MRTHTIDDGQQLVVDVGHSGEVSAILPVAGAVMSAADDGYVYLRERDGRSRRPPWHLPEVTCLVAVPAGDLVVAGTNGNAFGLHLDSGRSAPLAGFESTHIRCGLLAGGRMVFGCDDGTVRTVNEAGTMDILARLDAPVRRLAADRRVGALAYNLDTGEVGWIGDGEARARIPMLPGEAQDIAVVDGWLVVVGMTEQGGGILRTHTALGEPVGKLDFDSPLLAVDDALDDTIVVGLGDRTIRRVPLDLGSVDLVGTIADDYLMISHLVATADGTWVGTADGGVIQIESELELPVLETGAYAVATLDDGATVVVSDGHALRFTDLATLTPSHAIEIDGVVAMVGTADGALLAAQLDGTLLRLVGDTHTDVEATTQLVGRPLLLGTAPEGAVIVQMPEGSAALDPVTLSADIETASLDLARVSGFEREGTAFHGRGRFDGLAITVIDGGSLVVQTSTTARFHDEVADRVRIWDGERFLDD